MLWLVQPRSAADRRDHAPAEFQLLCVKENYMDLATVIPWGRSFNEYKDMFLLTSEDLEKRFLGVGDGPASFNAELTEKGGNIISVDPLYEFSGEQIHQRIRQVYNQIMSQMENNKNDYIWTIIASIEKLGEIRMAAMKKFLGDYKAGKDSGRYISASLPILPFDNRAFDLAVCSHYLFLYTEQVSQDEHILSIKELCRVATEVRIFPLLTLDNLKSRHLKPVLSALKELGLNFSIKMVPYQFTKSSQSLLMSRLFC